jgi:hypothetical protein
MLHDTWGGHDSEYEVGILARDRPLDHIVEQWQVLRVDNAAKLLGRDKGAKLEFADAVELIGPCVLVGDQVRGEAAHRAYSLGHG